MHGVIYFSTFFFCHFCIGLFGLDQPVVVVLVVVVVVICRIQISNGTFIMYAACLPRVVRYRTGKISKVIINVEKQNVLK